MKIFTSLKNNLLICLFLFCAINSLQAQENERKKNTNSWYENMLGTQPSNSNCNEIIVRKDFKVLKEKIKAKVSDISMLKYAKELTTKNCFTTKQIRSIMQLFSIEKHRLEYAVFAWPLSYNPDEYDQIYKGFLNSSSISKFNKAVKP